MTLAKGISVVPGGMNANPPLWRDTPRGDIVYYFGMGIAWLTGELRALDRVIADTSGIQGAPIVYGYKSYMPLAAEAGFSSIFTNIYAGSIGGFRIAGAQASVAGAILFFKNPDPDNPSFPFGGLAYSPINSESQIHGSCTLSDGEAVTFSASRDLTDFGGYNFTFSEELMDRDVVAMDIDPACGLISSLKFLSGEFEPSP